ncbi:MAG: methionine--tRNA ligase [bacterium]|nr:methionine--tRNA ligase [bacterium]
MGKSFYITTPIFYPNANPHMGHAYSTVFADIVARYHRLKGEEVYLLTGVDENTEKVVRAAEAAGKSTDEYLAHVVSNFKTLFADLSISYDQFIRTSDAERHWPGAIALWKKIEVAGDFEKRSYRGLYCVGHEAFITEKELVDGTCPDHGEAPQVLEEENYFFKLSKYTAQIKEHIESGKLEIQPDTRRNEILALLSRGLEDVSFSRPAGKVSVGVPVPNDPSQKMYVWCDALANYISALGFGQNEALYTKFWPADAHIIGKDILRFHAAIWPGMLLSAGLPLPKKIVVHGFITSGGTKMSKTLGNVVDPQQLISEYGAEAVRFYLARHVSPFEDSDLTLSSFKEAYNADLANGLGNLVSRIMKMAATHLGKPVAVPEQAIPQSFMDALDAYHIQKAADIVSESIAALDRRIQETEPFKLVKTDKQKAEAIIEELVVGLYAIARMLNPLMPDTCEKIKALVRSNSTPETPLFPRKE